MADLPTFGPFRAVARLGRGGSAEVWDAVHEETGAPVAVKRLLAELDAREGRAFRREVEAMASLDHPHVLRVWDHGEADGRAWVALERAEASLAARAPRSWDEIQRTALPLLDALAHAHAHELVHRDLKPGNLLLVPGDRPLRLADFGLAHVMGAATAARAGTPGFMAPEQIQGRSRDLGPWTDLYAFGCLLWRWATGAPPFAAPSTAELLRAHAEAARPAPALRTGMPPALDELLLELVALDPADRPPSAAAVALELGALRPESLHSTFGWEGVGALGAVTLAVEDAPGEGGGAVRPPRGARLPIPANWRSVALAPPPLLASAGLGLFAVRRVPIVGRIAARDRLWAALGTVVRARRPRAIAVEGPPGRGATSLGRWLCSRAAELDVATPFRVRRGLPAALREAWRAEGLTGDARTARLAQLGVADPPAAAAALEGRGTAAAAFAWLRQLAADGAVVAWIDDPGDQQDVADLLAALAAADEDLAVLVVTTGPAAPGGPFARHGREERLALEPLTDWELDRLLVSTLGLSVPTAEDAVLRLGREPGALLAGLRAAVSSGRGRSTPAGLEVDLAGDRTAVPVPWLALALLGPDVPVERWAAAVDAAAARGEDWSAALTDCARAGYAAVGEDGIGVADALRGLAADADPDDLRVAHAICGSALAGTDGNPLPVAVHRAFAGAADLALPELLGAARMGAIDAQTREALRLALDAVGAGDDDPRRTLLAAAAVLSVTYAQDPRAQRARIEALLARVERLGQPAPEPLGIAVFWAGDPDLARRALLRVAEPTDLRGWSVRGRLRQLAGDLAGADADQVRAVAAARSDTPLALANALNDLAVVRIRRTQDAEALLRECLAVAERHDLPWTTTIRLNLAAYEPDPIRRRQDLEALFREVQAELNLRLVAMVGLALVQAEIETGRPDQVAPHLGPLERALISTGMRDPQQARVFAGVIPRAPPALRTALERLAARLRDGA